MLKIIDHDEIVELQMDRPPANALNTELVERITEAHGAACRQGAKAIILGGRPGMFSAGLDVPELIQRDRAGMYRFWSAFTGLARVLATSPVPVVAAISGHSPAGGTVLAIHCDYRVAAAGEFRMGLNEVRVGLPVPRGILFAYGRLLGPRAAQRYAVNGRLMPVEEALAVGLVDELCPPEDLLARAIDWCRSLMALPPVAMNQTRSLCKAELVAALDDADDVEAVTDYWFSDETQAAMKQLVNDLEKRKSALIPGQGIDSNT